MTDRVRSFSHRSRAFALAIVVGVSSVLVPLAAQKASAALLNVGYTLEGCNLDHGGTYNNTNPPTCSDAAYTTGNLGKSWAELDLVPFRVTLDNKNGGAVSGNFVVAGDYTAHADTYVGWDVISSLTLNSAASSSSCPAVSSGSTNITPSGQGAGGANRTIYRVISASIPAGATCVYDYYMRLALGSHLFSGSSLQGNLWNEQLTSSGIGEKRVSIPVNEIAPQTLSKTMTATRGSAFSWTLTKTSNPTTLDFSDTCSTATGARQASVTVTVTWTRNAADPSGPVTITTVVNAQNPAHRDLRLNLTDRVYDTATAPAIDPDTLLPVSGSPIDTATVTNVLIPKNSDTVVLAHTFTYSGSSTVFSDRAVGTYVDDVTNIAIPGFTEASQSNVAVQTSNDPAANGTATITDVEDLITSLGPPPDTTPPANLEFSVDSATGVGAAGGSFGTYVLGTHTTGPVTWTSAAQTPTTGVPISAVFNKTVYVTQPAITSGVLRDHASLSAGSFSTTADAHTTITSSASASIVVSKTIDVVLTAADGSETFPFQLYNGATLVDAKNVVFNAGDGGSAKTATFTGLTPGVTYTVHEVPTSYGYAPPGPDQNVTVTLPSCSETAPFANTHNPAKARVKKVTVPAGQEAGWVFTLTGPGLPASGETITTGTTGNCPTPSTSCDPAGYFVFNKLLEEGIYTITETLKTNWDNTGAVGDFNGDSARVTGSTTTHTCTFTVNYPGDADGLFSCTFTNTKRGHVTLTKTESGGAIPAGDSFTFELCNGTVSPANDPPCTSTADNTKTVDSTTPGGALDFGFLPPGTYTLCELHVQPGWSTTWSLNGSSVTPTTNATTGNVCYTFTLAADGTAAFSIDNVPPPGGGQRTIGYWKNWSSCKSSNGHQAPVLDQTLELHDITLGDLVLHDSNPDPNVASDCQAAVNILNKTTINGATKKASDPLFNMAAQLLGAYLNVNAGAGTCPAATNAMSQAQALLAKYHWNGLTYTGSLTQADKTLAGNLNSILDRYNNGLLC